MPRLNKNKQDKLEPKRLAFAKQELISLGYAILEETETSLVFYHQTQKVTFFPYSGWHTGKTIKDGRGWKKLKQQLI